MGDKMKILVTDKYNEEHTIEYTVGDSLAETIIDSTIGEDVQPFAICGFNCSCRTCHALIEEEYFESLSPIEEDEDYLLNTSLHRESNSRLGCQTILTEEQDGMKVKLREDF